jgi:hypothetical protein
MIPKTAMYLSETVLPQRSLLAIPSLRIQVHDLKIASQLAPEALIQRYLKKAKGLTRIRIWCLLRATRILRYLSGRSLPHPTQSLIRQALSSMGRWILTLVREIRCLPSYIRPKGMRTTPRPLKTSEPLLCQPHTITTLTHIMNLLRLGIFLSWSYSIRRQPRRSLSSMMQVSSLCMVGVP